jgi:hypothetical protein
MRRIEVIQEERETSRAISGVRNLIHCMMSRGHPGREGDQPSYQQQAPEPKTPFGQMKTGSMKRAEVIQAERKTNRAIRGVRNLLHHMVR